MFKIILAVLLLASCSSVKKAVNRSASQTDKRVETTVNQLQYFQHDSTRIYFDSSWLKVRIDSNYSRVTQEDVIEWIDTSVPEVPDSGKVTRKRTTRRIILEAGNKATEAVAAGKRSDSSRAVSQGHTSNQVTQTVDSSGASKAITRNVQRKSFLPWWLWLIAAGVAGLTWRKRGFVLDKLFTPRNRA